MFYYIKLIFSVILSFILSLTNSFDANFISPIPAIKSEAELQEMTDIFDEHRISNEIFVVNTNNLTEEEIYAVVSLQGIVGRSSASIYIDKNATGTQKTAADLDAMGYTLTYTDENGEPWNYETLLRKFASEEYITDKGYVLYSSYTDLHQLNMATNYASIYGWLPVPQFLEDIAIDCGLTKSKDITYEDCSYSAQLEFYSEHKNAFVKNSLIHQNNTTYGLRDLAIQQKIFVTYTTEGDSLGLSFRDILLHDLHKGSPVLGWCDNEVAFVEAVTASGNFVIPSDHCINNSILCSIDAEPVTYNNPVDDIELDPDKHYVVLMYSDGDNVQWIQNGYNEFYTWQELDTGVPVTWTFPPLMNEFSTIDANRVLSSADDDCFICGPSGAGYTRMSKMFGSGLEAFTDLTAAAMLESGMTTVTILDTIYEDAIGEQAFINKLGYYSRYDNIKGGILQLDPDRYSSGEGRIYFVDDKPFISVRLSLWHPDGEGATVTDEWLQEQAEIINSYPADINSVSGYSVININPWTVSVEDFSYFTTLLDENVEVITADELICALDKYVPHENAIP